MSEKEKGKSLDSRSRQKLNSSNKRNDSKSSDGRVREKNERSSKTQREITGDKKSANEQRESDFILIKVGENTLNVKKEALIASSEYFKAKFAGNFADSNAKELDLTKDVDDIEDLKILLDFQCNKRVDITEDTVSRILRVSSFFLVDGLTDYCAEFMMETTCLTNCVQYYILAVNFALPERFTRRLKSIIQARFHDLIIFEDFVAEYINDEELKLLCRANILKHCSKENLFNFLLKWLSKSPELTDTQYTVASGVIQFFEQCKSIQAIPFQCDKKKTIANINRMTDTIRKLCDPNLLQNFQQLFTNFLRNKEPVFLHMGLNSCDTGVGIFTISKRLSVNRSSSVDRKGFKSSFYKPSQSFVTETECPNDFFDVCVYQPDSRVWFHIATFQESHYFSQVDGRPYCPNIQMRKKFPVNIFCDIEATEKEVLFCDVSEKSKLLRLDIETRNWTHFNINDIVPDCEAYQIVRCKKDCTFLVTRNCIPIQGFNWYESRTEFRGYTFDFKIPKLMPVFSTVCFSSELGQTHNKWCEMKVTHSSVSNEILIVSSSGVGDDLAVVVDLVHLKKGGKPDSHSLLHNKAHDFKNDAELLFVDVDILEIEDSFLVMSSANNLLTVKFQYKFGSKVLTKVEDGWNYALSSLCDMKREKWRKLFFSDSCWFIIEEYGHASMVRQIRFSACGKTDIEDHTPPPFVELVSACATKVRKSLFFDLEPIRNFLEHPKRSE